MADALILTHLGLDYATASSLTTARFTNLATGVRTGAGSTVEERFTTTLGAAGTASLLTIIVRTNNYVTNSKTLALRINGATGNSSVTVAAGATGVFQDAVNSDSLAAGDEVSLRVGPNFETNISWLLQSISLKFAASSGTAILWQSLDNTAGTNINNGTASVTRYVPLISVGDNVNAFFVTSETNAKTLVKESGTFSYLNTSLNTNSLTNNATVRFRVNGADGNQNLTLIAGVTGRFEDVVNSDAVIAGQDINASCTTGAGTITANVGSFGATFASSSTGWDARFGTTRTAALVGLAVGDNYLSFAGNSSLSTTRTDNETYIPRQVYAHQMAIRVPANVGAASTVSLHIDGADGESTIAIPANTTGSFEDGTGVDSISAGSRVCYRLSAGNITVAVRYLGVTLDTINPEGGDVVLRPVAAC